MLLERERELDLLADLLADVGDSGGRVVLIRGEAGIGKSALVREFVGRAREWTHVLVGYCDDLITARPFGPFWDMRNEEPSLGAPLNGSDRSRVMVAALDLLSRQLRPTVMVIEDTQWADEATLDTISFIGRRIDQASGLLLLTFRDTEVDVDHPLRGVLGALPPGRVVRIRLGGLSSLAVASLIAGSDLDADEIMSITDGNPFLVTELASVGGGTPVSVQESVMARFRKLSPEARDLLELLSVMPEWVTREELALLVGGGDPALEECERRGLLDVGGVSIGFHHELTRRAVQTSLTETERVSMNRRVLDALPRDVHPARLVHHALGGHDIDRLVEEAPRAAEKAWAMGSMREAVDHYRQLIPYLDRVNRNEIGSILDKWSYIESQAGSNSEAIRLGEMALLHHRKRGDVGAESGALAALATYYEWAGLRREAEESARDAIEVLGPDSSGAELATALEVNAYLTMMAGDAEATFEFADKAIQAAGPEIDEKLHIRCLVHRGSAANVIHYPDGRDVLDAAGRRAEAAGEGREVHRALINNADPALESRDLQTALDYARRAMTANIRYQRDNAGNYCRATFARILELLGEWTEAEQVAEGVSEENWIARMMALPVIGIIESRRGRMPARETLNRAWEMAVASGEYQRIGSAAAALSEHAWITGSSDIPLSEIKEVVRILVEVGWEWPAGLIALWLWKLGELGDTPEGIAEAYRLILDGDPLTAAAIFQERGIPYERAIALAHGDTEAQLEALEILEDLGARAVADKLRQELREQGVSVPRRRARHGDPGLTERQSEVLGFLAEGLSNIDIADRLFLSPRTVEHHVAAILSRLNASSRRDAVDLAVEAGLLAS